MPLATPAASDIDFEARLRVELERRMAVTPAMVHSIDEKGRLISVSDNWLSKLGYAREEVLGRLSSDFLTAASRDYAVRDVLPEFFRTGRCENVPYQMVCKDGTIIDVLLSAVLDKELFGRGCVSLAVITDVTALNCTRCQLAESEARYRGLVEDQSEFVSLATPEGKLQYVNQAYAAFYGKPPEEMIGRNLFEFVPKESHVALVDHLRQVCAAKHGLGAETQVTLPTGERRWLAWTNRALIDDDGRVTAIHSVSRDIEERVLAEQRLQASEARYRLLADNSTDVIAVLSRDGSCVYASPACFSLTGYTPKEMRAMRTGDSTHPDDVERVLDVLANHLSRDTVTYRTRRKDGSYVWVETTCKPLDGAGKGDLRLAIVRNVDERMRANQRLQESEMRYRFLADNSTDLIMLVGHDGKCVYVSPACEKLLGFTPEEMLELSTRDAIHSEDTERVLAILDSDERMRTSPTISYRTLRKDGSYIWVETTVKSVDLRGLMNQRLLIIRDIEQRRQAEQRLKDSEERYRMLADNSSDTVFQLDRELVRRYVSPACRELLGYEPEELTGDRPLRLAHPDDAARLELVFRTLLNGHAERLSIVVRIRHRDGRWIWIEASVRALNNPDSGATSGIMIALRDISVRKAVEDELAEANRRLQILAAQDGLTGLANRRAFDEALVREHLRAKREKTSLALIMIDVDRFKTFNDIYGHPAGDDCLRRVGAAIAETVCRSSDLAVRYGGEEFAVLLPNTDEDGAVVIGKHISHAILSLGIPHHANANGVVTISAGVAAIAGGDSTTEALVENADHALYRAKDFGRNAVVSATRAGKNAAANPSAAA